MIPTEDPTVMIERQSPSEVVYANNAGERWVIRGVCNCCGECYVGADDPRVVWTGVPVGQPGACYHTDYGTRLDIPVRPEIAIACKSCTLRGEYLK